MTRLQLNDGLSGTCSQSQKTTEGNASVAIVRLPSACRWKRVVGGNAKFQSGGSFHGRIALLAADARRATQSQHCGNYDVKSGIFSLVRPIVVENWYRSAAKELSFEMFPESSQKKLLNSFIQDCQMLRSMMEERINYKVSFYCWLPW